MPNESHLHAGIPAPSSLPSQEPGYGPGYEVRDTNIRSILIFIAGMFVALTFTQFAMWGLLKAISGGKPEAADPLTVLEGAPRQRAMLRRAEDAILAAKGGQAVLPIDAAIEQIARKSLPPATGPARTEVEVNSHSGLAAPVGDPSKDKPAPARSGEAGKGALP